MADQFEWWKNALAGKRGNVDEAEPQSGYYRNRRKGRVAEAVAYWRDDDGELRCKVDDRDIDDRLRMNEIWIFACLNPIHYSEYKKFRETKVWSDMDSAITPEAGHNKAPGEESELESIKRQIEEAAESLSKYKKIATDDQKAAAQSLRSRLLELSAKADKIRKKEGDPFYERYKTINETWNPLVKAAKGHADTIRDSMDAYDNEQKRKADEARRAAEAAQRKAEEDAAKAAAEGKPAPVAVKVAEPEPFVPAKTKGAYGRAATAKIVKVAKEITDWTALCAFLKINKEFQGVALEYAQRALNNNFDVPGIRVEEEVRNR